MKTFRKAILIIHGFAGGTYDQENLANYLELNPMFDVYTFTLPGHDVKDSKLATKEEWIKKSEGILNYLIKHGYKSIYLIGHSMGGVIASYLATKYKQVKKLDLAAPSFTHIASKEEGGLVKAAFKSKELMEAYSTSEFFTRIKKLPISALKEFLNLVNEYQYTIEKISVPTLILQGTKDQMVPPKSNERVFEKLNIEKKALLKINGAYHDLFKGEKLEPIEIEVEKFLKKPKFMIKQEIKEI